MGGLALRSQGWAVFVEDKTARLVSEIPIKGLEGHTYGQGAMAKVRKATKAEAHW